MEKGSYAKTKAWESTGVFRRSQADKSGSRTLRDRKYVNKNTLEKDLNVGLRRPNGRQ